MKLSNLERIKNLTLISKESLRMLEPNENRLNFNLKTWVKKGILIRLKKGRYILASSYKNAQDKDSYLEFLANKLYQPSYLSGEYVMNKYGLLTEAVFGISSITTKKTKKFITQIGTFVYYSINKNLFLGFKIKKSRFGDIFIAEKAKAVFDFLYLRLLKGPINEKVIEELRINWENLSPKEFSQLKKYTKKLKKNRLGKALKIIERLYYA